MTWIKVEDELPNPGIRILAAKIYLDEQDYEDSSYVVDMLLDNGHGCLRWKMGGETTHWMEIPELPKDA